MTQRFGGDCVTSQKNICQQNKLNFFFRRGLCKCSTRLGMGFSVTILCVPEVFLHTIMVTSTYLGSKSMGNTMPA